jgi:hypothetical protein
MSATAFKVLPEVAGQKYCVQSKAESSLTRASRGVRQVSIGEPAGKIGKWVG